MSTFNLFQCSRRSDLLKLECTHHINGTARVCHQVEGDGLLETNQLQSWFVSAAVAKSAKQLVLCSIWNLPIPICVLLATRHLKSYSLLGFSIA